MLLSHHKYSCCTVTGLLPWSIRGRDDTCSYREERLVHGVDVHVVDLVDAHNVAVAAKQGQHPQHGPWQQAPIHWLQTTGTRPIR